MENILSQNSQLFIVPVEHLSTVLRNIIKEELKANKSNELEEKMLSPKEVCSLFNPKISLVTLSSWESKGYLTKYFIGGRTWYKYSEVVRSLNSLKKYSRKITEL